MKLQQDLTQGDVFPRVATFALPLILSSLLQNLYNTADMYFVGRYVGTNGLAAVSICGPIMMVLTLTLNGLSSGISVVLANYKGGDSSENVRRTGNTAIALYAVLALAATLLGQLFAPQILRLVRTPEESFPDAIRYLRVVFLGVTFSFGYNLISALQRGFGDSNRRCCLFSPHHRSMSCWTISSLARWAGEPGAQRWPRWLRKGSRF